MFTQSIAHSRAEGLCVLLSIFIHVGDKLSIINLHILSTSCLVMTNNQLKEVDESLLSSLDGYLLCHDDNSWVASWSTVKWNSHIIHLP